MNLLVVVQSAHQALCERALAPHFSLHFVGSLPDARQSLQQSQFRAVILDHTIADSDGEDFLRECSMLFPQMGRVLLFDGDAPPNLATMVNDIRLDGCVAMPYNEAELVSVVKREVQRRQRHDPADVEHGVYRGLVFDGQSNLPTRQMLTNTAAGWLQTHGFLAVLAIDASELWAIQEDFGPDFFPRIAEPFIELVKSLRGSIIRQEDQLSIDELESSVFCIFLGAPRTEHLTSARHVEAVAERVQEKLMRSVLSLAQLHATWSPRLSVGHGFVLSNPCLTPVFQVRKAVSDARECARSKLLSDDRVSRRSALESIIVGRQVTSVFQPIFDMSNNFIFGYEGLSRGPFGTEYESPAFLLRVAERTGLVFELDRTFRQAIIADSINLPEEGKIFINTLPSTLHDPDLEPARLLRRLEELGIAPDRLVLEFSERRFLAVHDQLLAALKRQRELGIQIAVDDVGAGYSGLERISILQPEYLKIDMSLVHEIHLHPVKRSVLGALVRLAEDIGARVIAEGIEHQDELACLMDLGIVLAQGFLLAKPAQYRSGKPHR